jgi:hypothetical protein
MNHCAFRKKLREYLTLCTTGFSSEGFTDSIFPALRSPQRLIRD